MYRVTILPKALEYLSRADKPVAQRVADRLTWLSENIENINPMPLKGNLSGLSKLRVGDWRVIYEVNNEGKSITVHKIGHRREIYK